MASTTRRRVCAVAMVLSLVPACTGSEEPATGATTATAASERTTSTFISAITPATTVTTAPLRSPELVEGWNRLADGPLSARSYAMVAAVGEEVFVIGGSEHLCGPGDQECARPRPIFSDGAAWNVTSGRWRSIAPAPIPVWQGSIAVLDDAIFVLAGFVAPDHHLLRYDVAADAWTEVDGVPDDAGIGLAADSTGGRLIVFGAGYEPEPTTDWLFDPAADTWTEIPDGTSGRRSDGWQQWVFATEGGAYRQVRMSPDATATLERLDAADGDGDIDGPSWVHVGEIPDGHGIHVEGRWIVVSPFPPGGIPGARFDTVTGAWADPLPPAGDWDVSTPMAGVVDDGAATYQVPGGKVLDLRTDAWIDVPPLDDRTFPSVTAIGTDLFVFGGQTWSGDVGTQLADAWLWVPPPA